MTPSSILALCALFQLKHFVADYPLQSQYMLGKSKDVEWELPLLAHVGIHACGTFLLTCYWGVWHAVLFALGDAATHFVIDRIKAQSNLLGRFKFPSSSYFIAFGADQTSHHLVSLAIVWWLATH